MGAGGYEQVPGTSASDYNMMDPSGYTGKTANNLYGDLAQNMTPICL